MIDMALPPDVQNAVMLTKRRSAQQFVRIAVKLKNAVISVIFAQMQIFLKSQ